MHYDAAVAGAGPAGLMAAKTAAQAGLRTVLLEKRSDVGRITRACCEQLIMDRDFQGDTVCLEGGAIISRKNGFRIPYDGPARHVTRKLFVSPAGNTIHFAHPDLSPIVIKIDKSRLLAGLWEDCARAGVALRPGTHVFGARDRGTGVELSITRNGRQQNITADRLIIADGVNSKIAERMGINSGRRCLACALCVIYFLEGAHEFEPEILYTFFGRAYRGLAPITINAGRQAGQTSLVVIGNRTNPPEQLFRAITGEGALASRLRGARVAGRLGCAARAYMPLRDPAWGNVLIIGDAAAYIEVEMQGALACGFHAGRAAAEELAGRNGFGDYARWWQRSFEFNGDDWMQVAQGFALVAAYTDEELDYLFGLVQDQVLEGTYNQYRSPRLMWAAILRHEDRIRAEHPDLHAKIRGRAQATLGDML
jgi:digeranylgeranylglycerophospholipid reductase